MQLSLSVQLPHELGGISGSTCYLTTSAKLATGRLKQLSEHHPAFHASHLAGALGLQNVHTLSASTIPILDNVLSILLPNFIRSRSGARNPVKLVVVDALTELFHSSEKTTKTSIFTRSKDLNRIASALHNIASTYNVAILVLNEVIDRFDRSEYKVFRPTPPSAQSSSSPHHTPKATSDDMVYSDKSRWFNTCNSIPGEDRKEASLGLVWANQLNVRIMLTRTGRRRYLDDVDLEQKRAKFASSPPGPASAVSTLGEGEEQQATLVRRLSVIFSSVAPPVSLDYVVATEGVRVLADDTLLGELMSQSCAFANPDDPSISLAKNSGYSSQLSQPHSQPQPKAQPPTTVEEEDEWDRYWEAEDDISQHFDDFDALELSLTQVAEVQEEEPEPEHPTNDVVPEEEGERLKE
ncbi:hypothetical protein NMY22_g3022 [Coprinellus aureogranulatus]|nr:hypothetical protein NMY22_g3022 [Coprinellus aureogranulatus]